MLKCKFLGGKVDLLIFEIPEMAGIGLGVLSLFFEFRTPLTAIAIITLWV